MDISSLIEPGTNNPAPVGGSTSSEYNDEERPPVSRRQTVSSLLNDDDDEPPDTGAVQVTELNGAKDAVNAPINKESNANSTKPTTTTQTPRPVDPSKPKKYKIPPVYAQSWLKWSKGGSHNLSAEADDSLEPRSESTATFKQQISSTVAGLPLSITNIQPFEDLTRKITEWVFSHIYQLEAERPYVEVEFKLGTICDRSTEKRVDLPVITETVLRTDYAHQNTFFTASMTDELFGRANTFLDSLVSDESSISKQINRTRDAIYSTKQKSDNLRVTFDENGRVLEKINKRRVSDLIVFSPGDLLDFRVSISVEVPSPVNVDDEQFRRRNPTMVRNKNRQSYSQEGCQVDLTSVITPSTSYQNSDKTGTSKELEVELDSSKLLSYFNAFQDKSDAGSMDKFEELIRLGIDNTRLLARKISR